MTYREIMQWAARWGYPFLRIGEEADPPVAEVVHHGRVSYARLAKNKRLRVLASLRIERWNERATVQTNQSEVERILNMLQTPTGEQDKTVESEVVS